LKHYILKGIIYTNGNYFTARLIDKDFIIWYHDGQTTHSVCQREQYLMQIENSNQLKFCREQYKAIMAHRGGLDLLEVRRCSGMMNWIAEIAPDSR